MPADSERRRDDGLRDQLVGLLTLHQGNVLAVIKALNTRRTQVYRWLQRFGDPGRIVPAARGSLT